MGRRLVLFVAIVLSLILFTTGTAAAVSCTINSGVQYTRSASVNVTYYPGIYDKYFQISNSSSFLYEDWYEIPAIDHTIDWDLWSSFDGKQTVYMRFAQDPDDIFTSTANDSIVLDTEGPSCYAYSHTVTRHKWGWFNFSTYDNLSPQNNITIRIRNSSGNTKMVLRDGWHKPGLRHWDFYVNLAKGKYRIVVKAFDRAGNTQSHVGYAWLTVK